MDLNTIHNNFATKEDFEKMLEHQKPINVNKAVDILGYLIAKDQEDYIDSLFAAIDDKDVRDMVTDAVSKLDDSNLTAKKAVKKIVGTSVDITKLIMGDSDMEDDELDSLSSSSSSEWGLDESSDDEFDYKVE